MFILIEGVDATGKTEIAEELSKKLGCINYSPVLLRWRPLLSFIDKLSVKSRFIFYSVSNVITSFHVKHLLKNHNVILEQYIFSTAAFHSVLLNKQLKNQMLILPEKIIYLKTDIEVIEKRIKERGKMHEYEGSELLIRAEIEYERLLKDFANVTKINTNRTTVKQATNKILSKISTKYIKNESRFMSWFSDRIPHATKQTPTICN